MSGYLDRLRASETAKSEPNNKRLWDQCVAAAKRKFDVYPSQYANQWAAGEYKRKGGTWKGTKEAAAEGFKPPPAVQKAAKRGLELRKEHKRGGTHVGQRRGTDLSSGKAISFSVIKRMLSYFQRHEVDKKGKDWGNKSHPSAGYIAWLLWGGDSGYAWAKKIVKQQEKS